MSNFVKTAIFVMAMMFSVNFAFGQTDETDNNSVPPCDDVYISFTNMGNLPSFAIIYVSWHYTNPVGWIYSSFPCYINVIPTHVPGPVLPLPAILIEGKVTVDLPRPDGNGKYTATKWWSGHDTFVTFTNSDFVLVATVGPGASL
jgi:hypothetical protein